MTNGPEAGFKQRYVDFVVEELLPYPLHKHGTRCYVQVEKRNTNTMDLLKNIMQHYGLRRRQIGIAGLKDKHALAKQRFCFHHNDIKKYGEKKFFLELEKMTRIMDVGFSEQPLGLGSAIRNKFRIRLSYDQAPSLEFKEKLTQKAALLAQKGFPNYFGEQRFGFSGNNHRIAQDILEGGRKHMPVQEKMFKLQGYASRLFNEYLRNRLKGGLQLLAGDLLQNNEQRKEYVLYTEQKQCFSLQTAKKESFFAYAQGAELSKDYVPQLNQITGPLAGYNLLMSPEQTAAGKLEAAWKKHFELDEQALYRYKEYKLFGLRRVLWVQPEELQSRRQGYDFLLEFILPKSAYASVLVDELLV